MLMPFRYLIKKPKQGEKMNNAQELKAHLQDSNKARMYEAKKKQDKLKTYKVMASQTQIAQHEIEVKAKNEKDAEKIALETDINDWCDYDTWNEDALSVDEIEEVKDE